MYKQFMSKTAIKDNLPTLPFQQKMETYANLSSCSLISSTKLPPNYPLRILDTVLINLPRKKKKKKKKKKTPSIRFHENELRNSAQVFSSFLLDYLSSRPLLGKGRKRTSGKELF